MPDTQRARELVVVIGDQTLDWDLAQEGFLTKGQTWSTSDAISVSLLHGGSNLLADLVRGLIETIDPDRFDLVPPRRSTEGISPQDPHRYHSYALWAPFDYEDKAPPDSAVNVWRVERFLGLQRPKGKTDEVIADWQQLAAEIPSASLVVVDDAGLDFRNHPEVWKQSFTDSARSARLRWIILKMARPVAHGDLWQFLVTNFPERLIVVIPVNDLRLTQAKISRELSWERTAEDLAWELKYSPDVQSLSKCAHVVVSFDGAGALLFTNARADQAALSGSDCLLFFDPNAMEGMWTRAKGGMIGYTSCLVAAIAREVLLNSDRPNIKRGVQTGLGAMQTLHKEGYGKWSASKNKEKPPPPEFPTPIIVKQILTGSEQFVTAEVPTPPILGNVEETIAFQFEGRSQWTILQQRCAAALHGPQAARFRLATEIVQKGLKAVLKDVPLGRFGNLLTVDRREIEGFRSIELLIREYLSQSKTERPLSLAVFGAPGSGKSFGISEVAKSIAPDLVKKLTFNLSQFSSSDELLGAFHQVRDVALSGNVPLVFWDEFDSRLGETELGWLRYFLSPMQDGTFQEGEITHPIGRSIFVFAGGTKEAREDFDLKSEKSKLAKVPDFFSRLKGHLRVLGPDSDKQDLDHDFVIRRAILLRSFLERSALQIFNPRNRKGVADIDAGVLRAFLKIPKYRHGARSMESVVAMSSLAGKNRFERSSLPPVEQLDLHVNGRSFLALVQQLEFDNDGKLLEELAEKAHEDYCRGVRKRGQDAPYRDHAYAELPPEEKEQNRDQVRNIRDKLAFTGYVMVPARASDPLFRFPPEDLELLAEHEHARWMEMRVKNGWKYGAKRDNDKKLHPDILPWRRLADGPPKIPLSKGVLQAIGEDELSTEAKDKDRQFINSIPRILAAAGYTVVKVKAEED